MVQKILYKKSKESKILLVLEVVNEQWLIENYIWYLIIKHHQLLFLASTRGGEWTKKLHLIKIVPLEGQKDDVFETRYDHLLTSIILLF